MSAVNVAAPRAASRMTAKNIIRGRIASPLRVLLAGVEGIGKSTFGSAAPSPIFLCPENGTEQLDVARLPEPRDWSEVLEGVRALDSDEFAEFKTLVIDTADWLEPLVWNHVCALAKVTTIEEVGGGYGKGYVRALDEWRVLLAEFERLRRRGMHLIILSHTQVKPFKNPEGPDFDRYTMKLNEKASALLREWVDVALFANYETFANKDEKTKRVKGVSTGARLLYTQRTAAYDAKNRYDLPPTLPLDWGEFYAAVQAQAPADPKALLAACREKTARLAEVDPPRAEKATAAIQAAGMNAAQLARINDHLNALLDSTKE